MLFIGSTFIIWNTYTSGIQYLIDVIFSSILVFIIVFTLLVFNMFGGADGKLLIVMSILIPNYPFIMYGDNNFLPTFGVPPHEIFGISVLINSVMLSIIIPISMLVYNLLKTAWSDLAQKPFYAFHGYKIRIDELHNKHVHLLESYSFDENDEVLHKTYKRGKKPDENDFKNLYYLHEQGQIPDKIWVTPGMPFMIPITLGFLTAVSFGDLMFILINLII